MPWYYSGLIILFFLTGCSQQPQIGKKFFDDEDNQIIKAIYYEENNNTTKAIKILDNLYKKTDKYVYLKEITRLYFIDKNYKKTIELVDKFIKKYPNKKEKIIFYKIYSYIQLKDLNKALFIAKNFLKEKRDLNVYEVIGYIYIKQHKYNQAIKYLKSAYAISKSPEILAQMGDIFFKNLKKPNEAISYYQTHIRLYGCQALICKRLAFIYRSLYDYDNLIEIYKKLYYSTLNFEYANKIVYIYVENGEYKKALKFINKNKLNNLKYLVYKDRLEKTQNYQDAYKLYKYTKNLNYFFSYAVYKFEQSQKGIVDLRNVIANLEFLISKDDTNPLYLNYLGYILIDYDINPKKGVKLIKQALKINPTSEEILDSLAWGYYKLHQCKKAYNIIKKITLNDKEINSHKKLIRKCYDTTKNNHKNKRKSKKRKTHR